MEVASVIGEYIQRELLRRSDVRLGADTRVLGDGLLDSLQTVELVLFLEREFGVQVDPEEVTEENFATLRAIAGLVERKLREG